MIVEFFGPPGAGKTTLALRLADRLRAKGLKVTLRLSSRPGENAAAELGSNGGAPGPLSAATRRLALPAYELLANAGTRAQSDGGTAGLLTAALPRKQLLRWLRMRQYLMRLSNVWAKAESSREIWLFDQAYVQAAAVIALAQPNMTDERLRALLDATPQADLTVHTTAPAHEIERRLARRWKSIGAVGRLFEENLGDAHEQCALAKRIAQLLRPRRGVLSLDSADGQALDHCAEIAELAITDPLPRDVGGWRKEPDIISNLGAGSLDGRSP